MLARSRPTPSLWIALVAAVLAWCAPLAGRAQDPTRIDSTAKAVARVIAERAGEYETIAEQLTTFEAAWRTYGKPATYPVALALLQEARKLAREGKERKERLESLYAFVAELDRSRFTTPQNHHIDYKIGRYRALDGEMHAGQAELIKVLSAGRDETFLITRASAHYMVAYCSYYTEQLDQAAAHSARAADAYRELGDRAGALKAYDGAGTTYFALGMVDSALHYSRRGMALREGVDPGSVANLYLNYAEALAGAGRVDSAFYYAELGDSINATSRKFAAIARSQLCLGNLHAGMGRLPEAVTYYEGAVEHFDLADEAYHKLDPLDSLRLLYERAGDFRNAYYTGIRVFDLRDSLRQQRVRFDTDKLVAEYERDELARELAASRGEQALAQAVLAQHSTERKLAAAVVCVLVLLIGFAIYRARVRRRHAAGLQDEVDERTAELRERQASLERQTRRLATSNAELERFAYIASHDLKTPLRNVTSFLGLVERRLDPSAREAVGEYLGIAKANALQMHELVTDVLEFSRLDADLASINTPVKVSAVVEATRAGSSRELAEREARVECVGDAELTLPKGALEQVIGNLIGNGIKYNRSPRPLVRVVVTDLSGEQVRIAVSDNGIGIDPEFHERVFEVFRRLHTADEFAGTGVGLAACRKVVERLGGSIEIDSAVGRGSTFIVDLPRAPILQEDDEAYQSSEAQHA